MMKIKMPIVSKQVKLSLISLVIFGLVIGANIFFESFYLVWPMTFQSPVRIRGNVYPIKMTEKDVEEMIDEAIEEEQKKVTPTPTGIPKKSLNFNLVGQVLAEGNYTYTKYSKLPYYDVVLAGLKSRFVNWEDAAELEAREGGFDPGAINPTSGACGLPQALPCKKMGCSLTNIDCQLDWMKNYIGDRYGTVEKALKFRLANEWY